MTLAQTRHISSWLNQALWSWNYWFTCRKVFLCISSLFAASHRCAFDRWYQIINSFFPASTTTLAQIAACIASSYSGQLFESCCLLGAKFDEVDIFSWSLGSELEWGVIVQLHHRFHPRHHLVVIVCWKSVLKFNLVCSIRLVVNLCILGCFIYYSEWRPVFNLSFAGLSHHIETSLEFWSCR